MRAAGVGAPVAATAQQSLEDRIRQREACETTGEAGGGCFSSRIRREHLSRWSGAEPNLRRHGRTIESLLAGAAHRKEGMVQAMIESALRAVVVLLLLSTVPAHVYGLYAVALFALSRLRDEPAARPTASPAPR